MVKNHNDQLLIGPLWDPTMNWLSDVTTIEQTSIVIMIFHYVFSFRFRVKIIFNSNSERYWFGKTLCPLIDHELWVAVKDAFWYERNASFVKVIL